MLTDSIFISHRKSYIKIQKKDILFLEAQGAYVDIYVQDGKRSISTHLKSFLLQLDDTSFVQVSRKHAINLCYIDEFTSTDLKIKEHTISISKPFRSQLIDKLPIIRTKSN